MCMRIWINLCIVAQTKQMGANDLSLLSPPLLNTAAVDVREALPLNDSAVHISWNPLSIPDFEVDNYTVVYSGLTATDHRREERASQVFPGSATSAVIVVGLAPETSYMFRVFATVTVEGQPLEGELSRELYVNGEHSTTVTHTHTYTHIIIQIFLAAFIAGNEGASQVHCGCAGADDCWGRNTNGWL